MLHDPSLLIFDQITVLEKEYIKSVVKMDSIVVFGSACVEKSCSSKPLQALSLSG